MPNQPIDSSSVKSESTATPRKVSTGYLAWCLCLLGICGGQRFYKGQVTLGFIYLFTFGLAGIGQFADLFYIKNMVDDFNKNPKKINYKTPAIGFGVLAALAIAGGIKSNNELEA